jgi:hypothetical protein
LTFLYLIRHKKKPLVVRETLSSIRSYKTFQYDPKALIFKLKFYNTIFFITIISTTLTPSILLYESHYEEVFIPILTNYNLNLEKDLQLI